MPVAMAGARFVRAAHSGRDRSRFSRLSLCRAIPATGHPVFRRPLVWGEASECRQPVKRSSCCFRSLNLKGNCTPGAALGVARGAAGGTAGGAATPVATLFASPATIGVASRIAGEVTPVAVWGATSGAASGATRGASPGATPGTAAGVPGAGPRFSLNVRNQ